MSIVRKFTEEIKMLFVGLLGAVLLVIICSPLIGAVLLVETYGPEWLKWTISLAWLPALIFWDTITAVFKSIKGVFK